LLFEGPMKPTLLLLLAAYTFLLLSACMEEATVIIDPVYGPVAVGYTWVYAVRAYHQHNELGRKYEAHLFGTKTITLTSIKQLGDSARFDFDVTDSLTEVHGHYVGSQTTRNSHNALMIRTGLKLSGGGGSLFYAGGADEFPFGIVHEGCIDSLTCRSGAEYAGLAEPGPGKVYEASLRTSDTSGYRVQLLSFNHQPVEVKIPEGYLQDKFKDADYAVLSDTACYSHPQQGDRWVYDYHYEGGGNQEHVTGSKALTLTKVETLRDSVFLTFSERDSLDSGYTSTLHGNKYAVTTFSFTVAGTQSGDGFASGMFPLWTKKTSSPDYPIRLERSDTVAGGAYLGAQEAVYRNYVYMQGAGLAYYIMDKPPNWPSQEILSLRSFNGRPIDGDALAKAMGLYEVPWAIP
jgi:hypothetical protein